MLSTKDGVITVDAIDAFDSTPILDIKPLIGRDVEIPPQLAALLARPTRVTRIAPDLAALRGQVLA